MTTERDASDQLTAARGAAYAWLRATLASLPAAVTSLSVGCVLEDHDDRPNLAPRLRAYFHGDGDAAPNARWPDRFDEDDPATAEGWAALDAIDDDLRTHTAPFLFALGDEEYLTVTRAEIAAEARGWTRWPTSPGWWWMRHPLNPPGALVPVWSSADGTVESRYQANEEVFREEHVRRMGLLFKVANVPEAP